MAMDEKLLKKRKGKAAELFNKNPGFFFPEKSLNPEILRYINKGGRGLSRVKIQNGVE